MTKALPAPTPTKLDALTGLRFVAAFFVLIHHFKGQTRVEFLEGPLGATPVSFFFVLSGFVLTYVYHARLGPGKLKRYYFTRWARIWPLHATCLLLVLTSRGMNGPPIDWPGLRLAAHALLLQSWIPLDKWVLANNGVAWSISTEAFFYLMFPLFLIGGLNRFWWKYAALAVATLGGLFLVGWIGTMPSSNGLPIAKTAAHFNPAFRLLEFSTGIGTGIIFLAMSKRRQAKLDDQAQPRTGLGSMLFWTVIETIVVVLVVSYLDVYRRTGLMRWLASFQSSGSGLGTWVVYNGGMWFHGAAIYTFARGRGLWSAIASSGPLVYLGEISFALYMIHSFVIGLMRVEYWNGSTLSAPVFFFAVVSVVIGVSSLLYYTVEIGGKNALLALYEGKFTGAVREFFKPSASMFRSGVIWMVLACLIVPIVSLEIGQRRTRSNVTPEAIVSRAGEQSAAVELIDGLTLVAHEAQIRRQGLMVSLVWRSDRPLRRTVSFTFEGTDSRQQRVNLDCRKPQIGKLRVTQVLLRERNFEEAQSITVSVDPPRNPPETGDAAIEPPGPVVVVASADDFEHYYQVAENFYLTQP